MNAEEPALPTQAAFEEMRQHLEEEHGRDFESQRDVFYAGNASPDAVFTHRPETTATAEGFWCALCPGRIFVLAMKPGLSEERIAHLALHDPELGQVLAEGAAQDRVELVEAHEEEKSAAALLARHRRRARLRTRVPQPAAQERRERAQQYLLARYEEIGNVEEALWDLAQLRTRDPEVYRQVMGDEADYKIETLRKYWQEIPLAEREATKQRWRERGEAG
jgi:hypothetical protein